MSATSEELAFHQRMLDENDMTAFAELAEWILPSLLNLVRKRAGPTADVILVEEAVSDALIAYNEAPYAYDPNRLSLMSYLTMAAYGDYRNALAKEKRRSKGQRPLDGDVEDRLAGDSQLLDDLVISQMDAQRLWARVNTILPDAMDQEVGLVVDSDMPLLRRSLAVWRKLLIEHRKWIFVPSAAADRVLLTLGNALYPMEFAIVDTPLSVMRDIVDGHLPKSTGLKAEASDFVEEVGPQIVIGIYRASRTAPPYVFYAHREYAYQAALIVMADSVLQEHRGFPMLIDLADMVCRATFGPDSFDAAIQQAYVGAGTPFRYLGERETRR